MCRAHLATGQSPVFEKQMPGGRTQLGGEIAGSACRHHRPMIETIDTSYSPLLKRGGGPPQSAGWSPPSSSSSYGTTTTPPSPPAGGGGWEGADQCGRSDRAQLAARDEEEKDGGAARPPSSSRASPRRHPREDDGLPPILRRNSSDGWSQRSPHSSRKPPRQQKYSTTHRNNNDDATFDDATTGGVGSSGGGGGGILATDNLHVSVQVSALRATTHRDESEGRSPDPSGRHRRTHSHDVVVPGMRRSGGGHRGCGGRGNDSSFSAEYAVMNSESIKLVPDPRWGGGGGGGGASSFPSPSSPSAARSRTFSGCSQQSGGWYSTSTGSGWDPLLAGGSGMTTTGCGGRGGGGLGYYYGSTTAASNIVPIDFGPHGDDAAINANVRGNVAAPLSPPLARRHYHRHYRARSDISNAESSLAHASFDRSVEPVMTDMTKSVMFKGVTNAGVVKLQLPKDNFRLLIDRDLGEFVSVVHAMYCRLGSEIWVVFRRAYIHAL